LGFKVGPACKSAYLCWSTDYSAMDKTPGLELPRAQRLSAKSASYFYSMHQSYL